MQIRTNVCRVVRVKNAIYEAFQTTTNGKTEYLLLSESCSVYHLCFRWDWVFRQHWLSIGRWRCFPFSCSNKLTAWFLSLYDTAGKFGKFENKMIGRDYSFQKNNFGFSQTHQNAMNKI